MMDKSEIQQRCLQMATEMVSQAEQSINDLQEALLSETKSSVGDKYETARAMLHEEQAKARQHLQYATGLLQQITAINLSQAASRIGLGSLVITSQGNYYISAPLGKLFEEVYAISPLSPMAKALWGLKVMDEVPFNGRTVKVISVS
ncbi:MAG: hypothetical protein SFW35_09060 [Chitinophagales bacterium]|nr:hypothetical protein [Chitinophagales bacterium]